MLVDYVSKAKQVKVSFLPLNAWKTSICISSLFEDTYTLRGEVLPIEMETWPTLLLRLNERRRRNKAEEDHHCYYLYYLRFTSIYRKILDNCFSIVMFGKFRMNVHPQKDWTFDDKIPYTGVVTKGIKPKKKSIIFKKECVRYSVLSTTRS